MTLSAMLWTHLYVVALPVQMCTSCVVHARETSYSLRTMPTSFWNQIPDGVHCMLFLWCLPAHKAGAATGHYIMQGGFVWLFYGSKNFPADERPPIPYVPELDDPTWKPVYGV